MRRPRTFEGFVQGYLDYVEGFVDRPPSLDGLSQPERAEAETWISSLKASRGIDPYADPPSLDELLRRF